MFLHNFKLYINAQETSEDIVEIYFKFTNLTLDVMGLKITLLSQ